jgi:8-oxo-dGTP pyrophosphatase MutT (NUDIX family)
LEENRSSLKKLLEEYGWAYPEEGERTALFLSFLAGSDGLSPEMTRGHLTGSVWILNRERDRALLTHHGKLDIWVQPGGHVEPGETVYQGARREMAEETGLAGTPLQGEILFDMDAHLIPARKDQPSHYHFDLRYLMEADSGEPLLITKESKDLKWIPLEEIPLYTRSESVLRMLRKSASFVSCPVFGEVKEGQTYEERVGIYSLIKEKGRVALMKTPRGYFLPGGRLEEGETHGECLTRELAEEAGWTVESGSFVGQAVLFDYAPNPGAYLKMKGFYYRAERNGTADEPIEDDHSVVWFSADEAVRKLKLPHQAWAVGKAFLS